VRRTRTSRSSDRRLESIVASPASSQRLQISALRPSLPRESRRKGHSADGRRSGSTKSPSFDEAAVAANLALPPGERDRGRQRLVCDHPRGRIRHREGAPFGRLSIKSLQVRAVLVSSGNRGTSTTMPKLGTRRQARLYPRSRRSPKLRLGGRPWKPPSEAKVKDGGDSGVERFKSARVVMSVAEVG
jgi:hypothetical protein